LNPTILRPGLQCTTSDGSLVEVRQLLADEVHVRVLYLDSLDNPEIAVGSEREIPFEELIAVYQGGHSESAI
jgi:hypothetical protein